MYQTKYRRNLGRVAFGSLGGLISLVLLSHMAPPTYVMQWTYIAFSVILLVTVILIEKLNVKELKDYIEQRFKR